YHDQSHIALKLLGFEKGVNVTLGLPLIRTSVDHGTAFDRAPQFNADAGSMESAIELALCFVSNSYLKQNAPFLQ
ncbi:MAG: 4-hydroxythreonine-4-phosphate dehydrogenase PdxA, partial [bacterium]